jgi:PAS domain S-box-containing protein
MSSVMILPSTIKPLFENASIPLTIADVRQDDCPLVLVNRAFLDLVGYDPQEILGRNCRFLQKPGTNAEARAEIRTLIAEGREGVARLTNYKKSGERFELLLFLHPIVRANGAVSHILGSQYDVTGIRDRLPEPHVVELGDIIGQANRAIREGGVLIHSSMQVLADVNANLIRRALAKI